MRTLFHLLNKPEEAAALTYAGSTETTIEVAALRLSQLLSAADGELSFEITPSEIKSLPGKKDWYGKFEITRNGDSLAAWHIEPNHSYLRLNSKKVDIFPLNKSFTNSYAIGQLEAPSIMWDASQEAKDAHARDVQLFHRKLESLPQAFDAFFAYANLSNEEFRGSLLNWLAQQDESFHQYAHQVMYGVAPIDENRELRCMAIGSGSFNLSRHTQANHSH